jgi:hypothetical protein
MPIECAHSKEYGKGRFEGTALTKLIAKTQLCPNSWRLILNHREPEGDSHHAKIRSNEKTEISSDEKAKASSIEETKISSSSADHKGGTSAACGAHTAHVTAAARSPDITSDAGKTPPTSSSNTASHAGYATTPRCADRAGDAGSCRSISHPRHRKTCLFSNLWIGPARFWITNLSTGLPVVRRHKR